MVTTAFDSRRRRKHCSAYRPRQVWGARVLWAGLGSGPPRGKTVQIAEEVCSPPRARVGTWSVFEGGTTEQVDAPIPTAPTIRRDIMYCACTVRVRAAPAPPLELVSK